MKSQIINEKIKFETLKFKIWNLFRISDLRFRI